MKKISKDVIKQYIFVIDQITFKERKKKTSDTNLGIIWNILSPLLYMIILSIYYENIIIHDIDQFPVFVFTGVTILGYYSNGTKNAMKSLVSNKTLLIKSHVPAKIFVIQKILIAFREMIFSFMALIPVMLFFKIYVTWRVLEMIPILFLTTLTIFGIGQTLAVIFVYFADIDYLYSVFMTMMFYISGAFVPLDHLPDHIQGVLAYNPIFISIYLTRNSLAYNLPSHWTAWAKLIIWAAVSYFIGTTIFNNKKNDIIARL